MIPSAPASQIRFPKYSSEAFPEERYENEDVPDPGVISFDPPHR